MNEKVSLILTTYNSADNLSTTLLSIEKQDYPNIEVVIKDGGSTDATPKLIAEFVRKHSNSEKDNISVLTKSCPDTGIYDAMNQGIEMCTGDIIACFNDTYTTTDAISKYVAALNDASSSGEGYDAVHSDLVYAEGDKVIRSWHMGEGRISQGWMPGHPTLYIRRHIYDKYGLYKTNYKIAADYEFIVRILKDGTCKLCYIPETLISMYYGGTSSSSLKSYIKSFFEGYRALKENRVPFAFFITVKRTIKVLRQF